MTGRDLAAALVAALAYAAAAGKLSAVRRQRGARAPRALFLTLLALAVGWTLLVDPVAHVVDSLTGVDLLGHTLADVAALCTGCGTQAMLVYLTHDEESGRRLMRPRLAALAAAVVAMLAVFLAAEPARLSGRLPVDYGASDFYLAYSAPYLAYLAYIFVGISRLCWRSAREAGEVPLLALGLRLIAAGGAAGLVYVALRVGYIALARGTDSTEFGASYARLSDLTVAVVSVLVVVGATLPSWGWRLAVYRDVRQLAPLWRAVTRRFPDLAVAPAPSPLAEALPRSDLSRRRNRMVIEIRDAHLELRDHLRPDVAARAREQAASAGVAGAELAAVVEAAQIAVALHEPSPAAVPALVGSTGERSSSGSVRRLGAPGGGGDLAAEVAWLRQVSGAYAYSPVVVDVVDEHSARLGLGCSRQSLGYRLARVVTELTAPAPMLLALLLAVGAASSSSVVAGLGWGATAALFFSIAPFIGIVAAVLRGRLTDHHVTVRQQRPLVIVLSLASFVAGLVLLDRLGAPEQLVAVMGALLAAAVVGLLITLVWKISMHMAVAGCAAAVLPMVVGPIAAVVWPALVGIAWSRIRLRDHTPAQTVAGAIIGALVTAGTLTAVL